MKLVDEIKTLLDKPTDPTLFPYEHKNRIYVGAYYVSESRTGYSVFSIKHKKQADLHTKIAAVALAKTLNYTQYWINEIHRLDSVLAKHNTDSVFFDNVFRRTDNPERKLDMDMRLCDSKNKITEVEEKLYGLIHPKKLNNKKFTGTHNEHHRHV